MNQMAAVWLTLLLVQLTVQLHDLHALVPVVGANEEQASRLQGGHVLGVHLVPVPVTLPHQLAARVDLRGRGTGKNGNQAQLSNYRIF